MRLSRHLSYANVVATLALFLALAGGSLAVAVSGRDEIGSRQVDNNSLKSVDLKNAKGVKGADIVDSSLGGADVLDGSLSGADVGGDSLTGANVLESSLSEVPSATNADTVDGKHASELETNAAFNQTVTSVVLTTGPQDVVSTSITTERTGTVVALGIAELTANGGNDDTGSCRIRIAGVDGFTYPYQVSDPTTTDENSGLATFARELGVGTHTVSLQCSRDPGSTVTSDEAGLSVWGVGT